MWRGRRAGEGGEFGHARIIQRRGCAHGVPYMGQRTRVLHRSPQLLGVCCLSLALSLSFSRSLVLSFSRSLCLSLSVSVSVSLCLSLVLSVSFLGLSQAHNLS